jgi:hypothetical protein
MKLKSLNLRNLVMAALLVCVSGCGCNDDGFPPGTNLNVVRAVLGVATDVPGVPINGANRKIPIDIFFLLDDGQFMQQRRLGVAPFNPGDLRTHSFAAQRIMNNVKQLIEGTVGARIDGGPALPGVAKDDLDFAFGVGRYEDFGGTFARRNGDNQARPFILNMPLVRANHSKFDAMFNGALARTAPGLGTPTVSSVPQFEPNSGLEALYQIATGDGFDANGNGNTTDTGAPGAIATQTSPGTSGDVPAIRFVRLAAPNDVDEDGEPTYIVTDVAGNQTTIDDPTNPGNDIPLFAAGNLGGAGWRQDSAKFIILATDVATVAPTRNAPPVCASRTPPPPPSGVNITSTNGTDAAPMAPRLGDSIDICGFNGSDNDNFQPEANPLTGGQPWRSRFGLPEADKDGRNDDPNNNFAGVAPQGAHTILDTIEALNTLEIEVLSLAESTITGGPTKPLGTPPSPGEPGASIREVEYFARTALPWTWLTAIARLTGAVDAGPDALQSFDLDNPNGTLPLVYSMGDVWRYDPGAADKTVGTEAPPFMTPSLVDDLADRIYFEWLQKRFLAPVVTSSGVASLVQVFYDFEVEFSPIQPFSVVRSDGSASPSTLTVSNVQLPTWDANDPTANTDPITVTFPSTEWRELTDTEPLPAVQSVPFKIRSRLNRIEPPAGMSPTDPAFLEAKAQVEAHLRARGDGTYSPDPDHPTELVPNPISDLFAESVCHADGTLRIAVYQLDPMSTSLPGPSVMLSSIANGCIRMRWVDPFTGEQVAEGGTCPAPMALPAASVVDAFTCPVDLVVAARQPDDGGAIVTFKMPEAAPGHTISCSPPSGSSFMLSDPPSQSGMTSVVTCELFDSGSSVVVDDCVFSITVVDRQPPAMRCPSDIELTANDEGSSGPERTITWPDSQQGIEAMLSRDQVDGDLTADIVVTATKIEGDGVGSVTPISKSMEGGQVFFTGDFSVGTWEIVAESADRAGNVGTCSFIIEITETAN